MNQAVGSRRAARESRPAYARFARLSALLALVMALAASSSAQDSSAPARLEIGIASQVVAEAWNPLRFVSRDTPPATLTVTIDQGSLRQGEVPVVLRHQVPGGAGVSVFETLVYLNSFSSVTWTLRTADATIASGSLPGRDVDARPLDLVISREAGRLRAAYGTGARLVDVPAASLPLDSAAYSGVRSLLIDGTSAAPRLEAVAAAAAGGALVIIHGELPASHAELDLLAAVGTSRRLGAGTVVRSRTGDVAGSVASALASNPAPLFDALLDALTAAPMISPPTSAPQPLVLAVAAAFALLCVVLLRGFGGPGLLGALAVAIILSLTAWRALRPPEPQLMGAGRIALSGGELALIVEAQEHLTLPPGRVDAPGGARPLSLAPYSIDSQGAHFDLGRWRSLLIALPPRVADAPLTVTGGVLRNNGSEPLFNVQVVGLGPQARLEPGASLTPQPQESTTATTATYRRLEPLLANGSAIATSCTDVCTVWIVAARDVGEARQ